ncbi:MAG: Uma2 family endonuclease [Defluviitaleaceae bacterium]|nr:Uma2 family endonuclease [Defluviitaleaceae bacterium]
MTNLSINFSESYCEGRGKEIVDGLVVNMSPVRPKHSITTRNIERLFDYYLENGDCQVFSDVLVHFSKKDKFSPDVSVVCGKDAVTDKGIFGIPVLVAEVLSPRSVKRDRGYKKDAYEKYGVLEYWIVDVENRVLEVYVLEDNNYKAAEFYTVYDEFDLEQMDESERSAIVYEFKSAAFGDLTISVHDVFRSIL